jgi:hypothetical protein
LATKSTPSAADLSDANALTCAQRIRFAGLPASLLVIAVFAGVSHAVEKRAPPTLSARDLQAKLEYCKT